MPKHSHKCSRKAAIVDSNSWQLVTQKRRREIDDGDADKKNKRRKQNEEEQRKISRNTDYIESIDSVEIEEDEEIEPEESHGGCVRRGRRSSRRGGKFQRLNFGMTTTTIHVVHKEGENAKECSEDDAVA